MKWMIWLLILSTLPGLSGEGKAHLGVFIQDLDSDLREVMEVEGHGVLVSGVAKGSAAEKAGLAKKDIILRFNDELVDSGQALIAAIAKTKPDEEVTVALLRDGALQTLVVTMGERPDRLESMAPSAPHKMIFFKGEKRPFMGIAMRQLSDQLKPFFEVDHGVLIEEVTPESPAAAAGLKAGDVLVRFGDERLERPGDVNRLLADRKAGEEIALEIIRKGESLTFTLELGESQTKTFSWNHQLSDAPELEFFDGENVRLEVMTELESADFLNGEALEERLQAELKAAQEEGRARIIVERKRLREEESRRQEEMARLAEELEALKAQMKELQKAKELAP
jgi:C-terminal processing protease CtpA/Prc